MNVEEYLELRVFIISISMVVIALSTAIPMYGYFRRRWKGVAIGILIQPVVCAALIAGLIGCSVIYKEIKHQEEKKSAMVTVRSIDQGVNGADTLTWYLKADEECLFDSEEKTDYFDVIRLDSLKTSVSVEDRIVVRFDMENEKVTATDYDQPAEVVDVDWEKVRDYFVK